MIYLDTNVIIDILSDSSERKDSCEEILINALAQGPVCICDSVYAETSIGMQDQTELDDALDFLNISKKHPTNTTLFMAGRAFKSYKDNTAGPKNNVLPDFFIGAQAACDGVPLVTSDQNRMRHYFPDLQVIVPATAPNTTP
jgi:predicted nucleic acid-binding protein